MLKKSITYETFNGETVTEDFFFHLSRADIIELEVSEKGGLQASLETLIKTEDGAEIMKQFKKILAMAIGVKSADGKRFVKTEDIRESFFASNAYDVFFMELVTNTDLQIEFIQGIVPSGLTEENPDQQKLELVTVEERKQPEPKKLTVQELAAIDADDLKSGLASGRYTL